MRAADKIITTEDGEGEPSAPGDQTGRARASNRRRLVLYLSRGQVQNLKLDAVRKEVDVSALARYVFEEAGY